MERLLFSRLWEEIDFDDHPHNGGHGADPEGEFTFTHTNESTHEIIRSGLMRSPLFSGVIEGTGPRYCPSVEDKVVRFGERSAHHACHPNFPIG